MRLTGVVLLGALTLAVAAAAVMLASPFILPFVAGLFPFLIGSLLMIAAVIGVWFALYLCAIIGAAIYYIFRPMQVSRKPGTYSIKKTVEAGRRGKGESEDD